MFFTRFLERTACTVAFEWHTEAACAVANDKGTKNNSLCEVKSRNSQYTFNLEPLKHKPDVPYIVPGQSGFVYEVSSKLLLDILWRDRSLDEKVFSKRAVKNGNFLNRQDICDLMWTSKEIFGAVVVKFLLF